MSFKEGLKPCPFCGAGEEHIEARMLYPHPFAKSMLYVMCEKCGGAVIDRNEDHCLNDVKRAWNRRANEITDSRHP